jgi:hypothetical protein
MTGEPVILESGRWTYPKEGETPSETMRRLEAGGPDVFEGGSPVDDVALLPKQRRSRAMPVIRARRPK